VIQGVDNRQSPAWLREALEASGQRSINAIVDVTNFVMLETGQPMHAFDTARLHHDENGEVKISVRKAFAGEKIETLDGKDIVLPESALVIADGVRALAIAGVKGGAHAGVGDETQSIILESAVFNPVSVRKASKAVGITTDSSRRFEHGRAPEITKIAMDRAVELLLEIFPEAHAGEVIDEYPRPASAFKVGISASEIARALGIEYSPQNLARDLAQLGLSYEEVTDVRKKIVDVVRSVAGAPYMRGASVLRDAPRAFDCATLSAWAYVQAGFAIPRISVDQFVFAHSITRDKLHAGDLIFVNTGVIKSTAGEWYSQVLERNVPEVPIRTETLEYMPGTPVPHGIDHVGIYLGDGMVCDANSAAGKVVIEKLDESKVFNGTAWYGRIVEGNEERFVVTVPPERFDIRVGADIVEEVVRLMGYDKVPVIPLTNEGFTPVKNITYNAMLRVRNALIPLGFSEIFTYVFRSEGQVEVANPMAEGINFLRDNLSAGMRESLIFNARNAPLIGVDELLMFEIGTVFFTTEKEVVRVSLGVSVTKNMKQAKREAREAEILALADKALEDAFGKKLSWEKDGNVWERTLPTQIETEGPYEVLVSRQAVAPYHAISSYPFMLRDIALWSNNNLSQDEILELIRSEAGPLLVRDRLFDIFNKEVDGVAKTSYAFNLVFQAYDRTLSDVEINGVMARIAEALTKKGLEVR
jgi:phenylalanyl-tRNA synthetase beta subunit